MDCFCESSQASGYRSHLMDVLDAACEQVRLGIDPGSVFTILLTSTV